MSSLRHHSGLRTRGHSKPNSLLTLAPGPLDIPPACVGKDDFPGLRLGEDLLGGKPETRGGVLCLAEKRPTTRGQQNRDGEQGTQGPPSPNADADGHSRCAVCPRPVCRAQSPRRMPGSSLFIDEILSMRPAHHKALLEDDAQM